MSAGCSLRSNAIGVDRVADLGVSPALNLATWVAGQPLAYGANGYQAVTVTGGTGVSDAQFIAEDGWNTVNLTGFGGAVKVQGQVVANMNNNTILALRRNPRVLLAGEDVNGTTVYSFNQTPTGAAWAVNSPVYIRADGTKWDDTAVGTELPYGRVVSFTGPATAVLTLEIDFNRQI